MAVTLSMPISALAQQPAPGASAEDPKQAEAKSRFKAGLTLYDDGAFDAARVQFERAYELAPSYKILYNIGLVYKQLNEFVGSLKALQQYMLEGGNQIPDDRRQEVTKLIEQLRPIIASAEVTTNVPGAEITVDDAVVGKAPMSAPVLLNPGRRKVGAKMPGKLPDAKVVTVAGGDKIKVDLNLQEAIVINQSTDVKPIIAWGITGGMAIGAGITGFLAKSASNDREDLIAKRDTTHDDLQKALNKQNTLALISDILTVGTVLSAGVAVYFTWIRKAPDKEKKSPSPAPGGPEKRAENRVKVTPGIGSLLVQF
jgi:hypothetical protein